MNSNAQHQITFAWWNTGLAPSAVSRSTQDQRDVACSVIIYMMAIIQADLIALGEMSDEDFSYVAEKCAAEGYVFVSEITDAGKSTFDICYVYNSNKLFVYGSKDIISGRGKATLKVAKKLELLALGSSSMFHVYISHWPSRLWCSENNFKRSILGVRLRDQVDTIIDNMPDKPLVVLLGDYNDEPFAQSLSELLMASRDIDLVRRKPDLLYNPFWKHLSKVNAESQTAGSYFYKGGEVTKWLTFDQVIFSHAFIEAKEWRLLDDCEHILDFSDYTKLVKSSASKFDHLPVYGTIEKVA
ncbi:MULTISPECIES: endonuclease/exonuclease/phosphatase family protein [Pseudomonas]|uniref:endonuclease/exonuclease/phosphatase family protein n=1 Tax=Pseudomonas TaxID=286 RepID=UPI0011B08AF3|nr:MULTISPECIES: endonuclease/exonuclease/phosphatase family protein [Pseudomonas]WSO04544.1 endonuclease/exonuclease/phosphatase family protein [Pseudomonas lurida]